MNPPSSTVRNSGRVIAIKPHPDVMASTGAMQIVPQSRRSPTLIGQCDARNRTKGAEQTDAASKHIDLVGPRLLRFWIKRDILWMFDQNAFTAFERKDELAKWRGTDQPLNFGSHRFQSGH